MAERYLGCRKQLLESTVEDPSTDFAIQMSKLAEGLLTDKYCGPPDLLTRIDTPVSNTGEPIPADIPDEYRIAPRMFKYCVAQGHSEFSSGRQQDASEYFMHLLQVMSRTERASLTRMYPLNDIISQQKRKKFTSSLFEFEVESRYECTITHQVRYISGRQSLQNTMELRIPLTSAVNKKEVEQFQEFKKQKLETSDAATGNSMEEVKLLVPWEACLDTFFRDSIVEFRNPSLGSVVPTTRRVRMSNFPRYLMIKLGRYYTDDNWVQVIRN